MNNVVTALAPSFSIGSSSFLQAIRTPTKSGMDSKFGRIRTCTYELPALERLKKSQKTSNGRNVVTSLVLSIFNGSSSYLQIRRTTIKAWMSMKFVKIPWLLMELVSLMHLKN